MGVELTADNLGRVARRDKQIAVPVRPALRQGVRLRRSGDAVMLDGADKRQAFTGKFALESLGRLAAACDGTATHAELAATMGLDEAVVHKCLALLWASGALEEGAPDGEQPAVSPELACLLSRLGNATGANRSWTDAAARLDRATVHVLGHRGLTAATASCLDGVVDVVDDLDRLPIGDDSLVVFFETEQSRPELAELQRRCWLERRSLLRVRADSTSMTMGPYVDPAFTPCLECGVSTEDDLSDEPPRHAYDLIAGLVAHHVLALVSRSIRTYLPLDAGIVDLTTLSTRYRPSTTRPGCPTCSFSEGAVSATPPSCATYEAAVALPVRRFLDPRGHLAHFQSSNIKLQWEFRTWPSCPRVALPDADVSRLAGDPLADRANLGLPDVALLLAVSFGIRERSAEWVQRWTAAGGNIGSATAYVISRDDAVLPVGGYAYREQDHALAQLTTRNLPGDKPLLLVVTANLKKMAAKYGTFGLRLALCDAGCGLSTARKVADHLNLDFSLVTAWDDHLLSDYLGLSLTEEPIAAVMEVG